MGDDALGLSEETDTEESEARHEINCAISLQALSDQAVLDETAPTILEFKGSLNGQEILLLVDSGSTTSFVNKSLLHLLPKVTSLLVPVRSSKWPTTESFGAQMRF